MKKIKFGSFPLIKMTRKDRNCVDRYSIKNYADLITLNSAVKSNSATVDKYITPYAVYKYFKQSTEEDVHDLNDKSKSMKRAFRNLKEISIGINNIPFYSDKVAFPIYLEQQSAGGNNFDYDFLLLTNDLVDKQILDEIIYDDIVTLLFLVVKDQFYPYISLPQIGNTSSNTAAQVKKDFAQFLEYCKKYDSNPINVFLTMIRMAAHNKFKANKNPGYIQGMMSRVSSSADSKLSNLFANGEIKSVDFFVKALEQSDIARFMNADDKRNNISHLPPSDDSMLSSSDRAKNYVMSNDATKSSALQREYLLSKTHHYNKILSVVDALLYFNKDTKIIEEINDGTLTTKIIAINDSNVSIEFDVNVDKIIDRVRSDYFDEFVRSLVLLANTSYTVYESKAITQLPKQVRDMILRIRQTNSPLNSALNVNNGDATINSYMNQIDALTEQLTTVRATGDEILAQAVQDQINSLYTLINKAQQNKMLDSIVNKRETSPDKTKASFAQFRFEENIGAIQGSLIFLLNELELKIYDKVMLQKIFTAFGSKGNDSDRDAVLADFESTFASITSEIIASFVSSYEQEIINLYSYQGLQVSVEEMNLISNLKESSEKDVQNIINDKLKKSMYKLLLNATRDFGTVNANATFKYAEHRVEKNPIIKSTINKSNNFKTFVVSKKILLDLYEILLQIDSQKYLAGLLAYPPSKVMGDLARMKIMITRLGLSHNPVFVYDEQDGSVLLSSPDILSLTGTPIYNKITGAQMQAVCKLDLNTQLWSDQGIMKKVDETTNKLALQKTEKVVKDIRKKIHDLEIVKTKTKLQNDALVRERQNLIKAEENLIKIQAKQQNAREDFKLTTSIRSDFNPEYSGSFEGGHNERGYSPISQPNNFNQSNNNMGNNPMLNNGYINDINGNVGNAGNVNSINGSIQTVPNNNLAIGNGYQGNNQIGYRPGQPGQQVSPDQEYKDRMKQNIVNILHTNGRL